MRRKVTVACIRQTVEVAARKIVPDEHQLHPDPELRGERLHPSHLVRMLGGPLELEDKACTRLVAKGLSKGADRRLGVLSVVGAEIEVVEDRERIARDFKPRAHRVRRVEPRHVER